MMSSYLLFKLSSHGYKLEFFFQGTLTAIRDWFRDYKIPDGKPANKFGLGNKAANKVSDWTAFLIYTMQDIFLVYGHCNLLRTFKVLNFVTSCHCYLMKALNLLILCT